MTSSAIGEGKVSIVIPCFNQGPMLREALASVEQVRNANVLEVIIVDDGPSSRIGFAVFRLFDLHQAARCCAQ